MKTDQRKARGLRGLLRGLLDGIQRVLFVYLLGSLIYLLVLGPTALLLRLLRRPPLDLGGPRRDSYWVPRAPASPRLEQLRRQF